jgi:LCP family protein required for cell wall assembly
VRRVAFWVIIVLLAVGLAWGAVAYLGFRSAVRQSNARVPAKVAAALATEDGPALTSASNILVIGSDTRGKVSGQDDPGRSDSLMILHVEPSKRRFNMLSIPRDLRVDVPGYGKEKINAAYSLGGPALTIRTVRQLTGLPIHHYVLIDFHGFRDLIDALGGIDIVNPSPIVSNRFDGRLWRYGKGPLHLDGRRALAYSRVRENRLDPNESDLTRGQRQQRVFSAIADKVVGFTSVRKPGTTAKAVMGPITTEITPAQFLAFGLGRGWTTSSSRLHCRLGGEIDMIGGQSVIVGDDTNRAVVRMFLGKQEPLRPDTHTNQFAGGCTRGG